MLLKKDLKKQEKSAASKCTSFCGIFRKKNRKSIQKTKSGLHQIQESYRRTYMTVNKKCNTGKYAAGSKIKIKILIKVI